MGDFNLTRPEEINSIISWANLRITFLSYKKYRDHIMKVNFIKRIYLILGAFILGNIFSMLHNYFGRSIRSIGFEEFMQRDIWEPMYSYIEFFQANMFYYMIYIVVIPVSFLLHKFYIKKESFRKNIVEFMMYFLFFVAIDHLLQNTVARHGVS